MKDLRLSVIVPVYNVEKYLTRCLKSLIQQDISNTEYEVIIVNDGSTDNSFEIAKSFASDNENFVLLTQPNGGLSSARNTGFREAKGNYIFFVDSDDFVVHNLFNTILSIAEKNKLDICFFKPMVYYGENKIVKFGCPFYADDKIYSGDYLLTRDVAMTSVWHALYNRKFLESTCVRFSEGLLHEDIDFHLRLFPFAKRIIINNINGYFYCQNGESILRTKNTKKIVKLFESEFEIVNNVILHSSIHSFSNDVKKYYSRQCGSLIFAAILGLIKNDSLSLSEKRNIIKFARAKGVYPMWRLTKSWKSTFLLSLFNFSCVLKILFRFRFLQGPEKKTW